MQFVILEVVDEIDAGGKQLLEVCDAKNASHALYIWVLVLQIYGSYRPLRHPEGADYKLRSLRQLAQSIKSLKRILVLLNNF